MIPYVVTWKIEPGRIRLSFSPAEFQANSTFDKEICTSTLIRLSLAHMTLANTRAAASFQDLLIASARMRALPFLWLISTEVLNFAAISYIFLAHAQRKGPFLELSTIPVATPNYQY